MDKVQRYIVADGDGQEYIVTRAQLAQLLIDWRNRGAYIENLGACRKHVTIGDNSADVHSAI